MQIIRDFLRNTKGAVALEAVIITPILAWMFVASFVFFDAFRTYATSLKATYSIADVLSRQTELIYAADIEGLADIFQHLTRNTAGSSMRVSEIAYDLNTDSYSVTWSYGTDGETVLRNSDMTALRSQLPTMHDGERVIVVETFVPYRPFIDMGLDPVEFTNFTVTRPRFAGQLPFDNGADPSCTGCLYDEEFFASG